MTLFAFMPVPTIGRIELVILVVVGIFLIYSCRRGNCSVGGTLLRVLGIAAVVAGVAVLWTRSASHVDAPVADVDAPAEVDLDDPFELKFNFDDGFSRESFVRGEIVGQSAGGHSEAQPSWMLISLGTILIILGALLFGRERTRPSALRLVTILGVGAILYTVVAFFTVAPRSLPDSVHVARLAGPPTAPREVDPGRAKRPALRPHRPTERVSQAEQLPARRGEIPVSAELAKASQEAESTDKQAAATAADKPAPAEKAPDANNNTDNNANQNADEDQHDDDASDGAQAAPGKPAPQPEPAAAVSEVAAVEAPPRPDWVGTPPGLAGNVYVVPVPSGRYVSIPECQHALDEAMQHAVDSYINEYLGDDGAAELVNASLGYIRHNLKKDEYAELVQSQSVGPMHQLHARLEFSDQARADFQREWRSAVVEHRLLYTGGGAVLVLALLSTFYGYLKLDLKTGGAHKGSLQLAATLVALVVAAGVLIARRAVNF